MDWLTDLLNHEKKLKRQISALQAVQDEDQLFETTIRPRIEEMQAKIDDYQCGRNETERIFMDYEIRLYLPVFSHLRSIYAIHSPVYS